jgi:hypothetical protein
MARIFVVVDDATHGELHAAAIVCTHTHTHTQSRFLALIAAANFLSTTLKMCVNPQQSCSLCLLQSDAHTLSKKILTVDARSVRDTTRTMCAGALAGDFKSSRTQTAIWLKGGCSVQ